MPSPSSAYHSSIVFRARTPPNASSQYSSNQTHPPCRHDFHPYPRSPCVSDPSSIRVPRNDGTNDEVKSEGYCGREDERAGKFHADNKLHRKTECPTEIANKDQLGEVVYCRVNPTTTLGKKDPKGIWHDSLADCRGQENVFALRESL